MKSNFVAWPEDGLVSLLPKRYVRATARRKAARLADTYDTASGLYLPKYVPAATEGAVSYLRVDNVRQFVPNLSPIDVAFVPAGSVVGNERVLLRPGDVVLARTGTLGRTFVANALVDGAVMSQHVTRLRRRDEAEGPDPYVLMAYLNSTTGRQELIDRASGSTRLELTHAELEAVPVPVGLSSVSSQPFARHIDRGFARQLQSSIRAIEALDRLIPEFSAPARGRLAYLLKGDLPAAGSWLPRFHDPESSMVEEKLVDSYECVPLGAIADVVRGAGTLSREYQRSGDIPFVLTSSIVNYGLELFPEHSASEATYARHRQEVGEDDILLTMEGKIGCVAWLGKNERCAVKNHVEIVRLRDTTNITSAFLAAYLMSQIAQTQLRRRTIVQATIPGLGSASREVLVPVRGSSSASRSRLARAREVAENAMREARDARISVRHYCRELARAVEEGL